MPACLLCLRVRVLGREIFPRFERLIYFLFPFDPPPRRRRPRYGIPGSSAKGFEKCLARNLGETLDSVSEHLYRITKMLSPVYLQEANVSGGVCIQEVTVG